MATIITKTIGLDGWQDFSTVQAATDAITTSAVANTNDLVTADVAVVFEIYPGTYSESVVINEGLTCDATRNVTYRGKYSDDKPFIYTTNYAGALRIADSFVVIDQVKAATSNPYGSATQVGLANKIGIEVKNCELSGGPTGGNGFFVYQKDGAGTAAVPLKMENCVVDAQRPFRFEGGVGYTAHFEANNNTFKNEQNSTGTVEIRFREYAGSLTLNNNIVIHPGGSHTVSINTITPTGSGNIAAASWSTSILAGSQYWTYTTNRTAASTGSQVVYDANDFSLINVAGNDAIGVGTATGVPTTDINGVDRVRGVGTQYVDPGAFTSDLFTYTRTIGPGRHYADFTTAESAITTIPRDTNLAQQNLAIVFEADAGDYTENLSIFTNGGITCDSTRNVTFKAAAGSEHGGNFGSGVNIIGSCGVNESFAVVDGLSVTPSTGTAASIGLGAVGAILRNLMSYSTNSRGVQGGRGGTAANPNVVENCVAKSDTSKPFDIRSDGAAQSHWRVVNCTAMATGINQGFIIGQSSTGNTIYLELVNNVVNGGTARSYFELAGPTVNVTGSNNAGPDDGSAPFPAAVQAGSQTWTTTTDTTAASTGSQIIYTSATGELVNVSGNDVIGVGTASAAPTTDINGVSRIRGASNEYVDPGAFSVDKITYTRTIGKDGWQDYDDFTDAEAESDIISYDTNLPERNLEIVFNAYAEAYSEDITIQDGLTTSPNNTVTYKAATGAEHNGDSTTGVRLGTNTGGSSNAILLEVANHYRKFLGLVIKGTIAGQSSGTNNPFGFVFDSCFIDGGSGHAVNVRYGGATPNTVQNCVIKSGNNPFIFYVGTGSRPNFNWTVVNNTIVAATYLSIQGSNLGVDGIIRLYNNAFLNSSGGILRDFTGGSKYSIFGGSNVTPTVGAHDISDTFKASNQDWTFTTDTTAASTGSQVIFNSDTSALVNVSGNDAVGLGDGTQAPTTDINGVSRIRGADDEYADPGAFTTSLKEIVRSVGSTSRDYETLTLAKDAAEGLSTNLNLAQRNEKIIFEFYNDGTPQYHTTIDTNLISDPERHVQYKNAPGQDVIITNTAGSYLSMQIKDSFTRWSLGTSNDGVDHRLWVVSDSNNLETKGVVIENCTLSSTTDSGAGINFRREGDAIQIGSIGTKKHPHIVRNVRFFTRGFGQINGGPKGSFVKIKNCTFAGIIAGHAPGNIINYARANEDVVPEDLIEIRNCVNLDSAAGDANIATNFAYYQGSNNVGGTNGQFNFKFSYLGMGTDFTSTSSVDASSTGTQVIYDASGRLVNVSGNDAVGFGDGSYAPSADINGTPRLRGANNEYADPGAFSVDKITYTKTIGLGGSANGFDFGDFIEAEGAVNTIPYDANLAKHNLATVFEIDAGVYPDSSTPLYWNTTNDPSGFDDTRNVTLRAASGSEHGGDFDSGVRLHFDSNATIFNDQYMSIDGLVFKYTASTPGGHYGPGLGRGGIKFKNCLVDWSRTSRDTLTAKGDVISDPVVVDNCYLKTDSTFGSRRCIVFDNAHSGETINAKINNCTFENTTGNTTNSHTVGFIGVYDKNIEFNNCLSISDCVIKEIVGDVVVITGTGNVGGATNPFPSSTQAENQTWTFTTDTTASSTGSQVIYASATGELVNVSGNDAVGVGDGTNAPSTDINGVSRLRGTNNEYADPGAFTTDLLTFNKKIGPYREYTSFGDAEADVVAISTDGNLAQRNEAIVFEADAGTYAESVTFDSGLISDATRNVTYKAGAESEHGGLPTSGVRLESPVYNGTKVYEAFTAFDGIVVRPTFVGGPIAVTNTAAGVSYRNVIFSTPDTQLNAGIRFGADSEGLTAPVVVENCVVSSAYISMQILVNTAYSFVINNCTATGRPSGPSYFILRDTSTPTISITANNNSVLFTNANSRFVLGSGITWAGTASNVALANVPSALQAGGQHWTFTTDTTASSTGNQVVYEADTGKMLAVSGNDAIGIATVSAAPTTDINGVSRLRGVGTQYADPGAFTTDVNTITKTIGIGGAASGFDFDSFVDAEAAASTSEVTYDTNLVKKNIAIVFEADAGEYEERVSINGPLTTDATRNVTYTAAANSKHGGVPGAGVVIKKEGSDSFAVGIDDSYTKIQDIEIKRFGTSDGRSCVFMGGNPSVITFENVIINNDGDGGGRGHGINFNNPVAGYDGTLYINNCLFVNNMNYCVAYNLINLSGGPSVYADNNTVLDCQRFIGVDNNSVNQLGTISLNNNVVGNINGGSPARLYETQKTDTLAPRSVGTGNIGVSLHPTRFDSSAIVGSQVWTFTSATDSASTGSQLIYDPTTYKLVNVSGNDAIGVGTGSAINVPASDILGKSRLRGLSNEYTDPGAFTTDIETTTLTANPGTLSSLMLNLTPYITTTNMAKRNESITIELEKADYPHLNFTNTQNIIGDSVRNITIKPQEGAHHKGIRGAGIRFISANTGFDTFGLQDVSGFTIEGVELYAPSGDIGRYLMVERRCEAITHKDIIFNNVEKEGHNVMRSTYENGQSSPISFKNCLFITTRNGVFVSTFADRQIQGKYELTNCTLSSTHAGYAAIQFDCVYAGTFEVNLTNNLFLVSRNIQNRWIGQTVGFFGDAYFYGSNNTGPDTPNYQLPDAIRSTLYPIEPTTDYTPVPSSPAAVYRASTLQLLDVPNNDVLQIGVGTSDSDVPTEGIGGQTRATSSCNPGCWEDNYELVDLQINTLEGVEGFRNPLRGSDTTVAFATLPDDAVPMFIVIGDSTAQGFSVTSPSGEPDADSYKSNTRYWPTSAYDGSAYGYFWDKFMTSEDNGATWTKSYPDYVTTDSSGSQFLPLHPRLGGISYGTFTYSVDPDHTQLAAVGNCSPIWDFAIDISGIFKNSAGDTVAPRFVYLALPQSRLGANGPDVGGFTNFNFSPNGFLFNTLLEAYIKPAVDSVLNEGKNPVLVGVLILAGGTEANIAYNPNPDGDKVSASGAASYLNFLSGITDRCNLNGRFPYMAYQVWDTSADPTNFPAAYTGLMRKALYSIRDTHINREPILQDLLRDKEGGPANSGVHFLQKMYPKYGQRFGTQYRSLLSMNRYPIYARTLSDIFD